VPGAFVTATELMLETRASTGFAHIGGKSHTLLSGNNTHIKNHADL